MKIRGFVIQKIPALEPGAGGLFSDVKDASNAIGFGVKIVF
jgi:hypothetical protein